MRARIDERFIAPFKRNTFATRTWFLVTVALVLAMHAAVLGYFLYRDTKNPVENAKQQEETPVEVVVEQEAPKPPPQEPQKQQQQEIEKPASSAPRAERDAKIDTEKLDTETHAPKAANPPQDGQPLPAQDAAQPNTETDEQDAADAAAANPDDAKKDAEALDKAAPTPTKDPPKPAKAKVASKQKRPKAVQQQVAGLSDLPDYHFARKTKKSPISGGTEDSRYLAIVYGLISAQIHASGEGSVTVVFELDESGDVIGVGLSRSSGNDLADAEVINAIRRASPFPPPPPNRPHGLTATIDFSRVRRPVSMGER